MKNIDKTQLFILILIVLTTLSIFNLNQLKNQVTQLEWQISAQENSIINQISGIETIVYQMKEADRWYQEVESPKLNIVEGKAQLNFKFKLLEYISGSKVYYHVKKIGSEEFETHEAIDIGSGIYKIQLSEIGPFSPVSKFDIMYINSGPKTLEVFGDVNQENVFEYYISVEHDEDIRISETHWVYMYDLVYNIFQPISGRIEIDDQKSQIKTNLDSNQVDLQNIYYLIERVTLQAYLDNGIVQSWDLKEMNTDSDWIQYVDTLEITEEYDSLYVEVKYVGRDETTQFIQKNLIGSKR